MRTRSSPETAVAISPLRTALERGSREQPSHQLLIVSLQVECHVRGHLKLAAYYRVHAAEHEADARLHDEIVIMSRKRPADDDAWELARGAAHYAEHSREAAAALRELVTIHQGMAERAPRK